MKNELYYDIIRDKIEEIVISELNYLQMIPYEVANEIKLISARREK